MEARLELLLIPRLVRTQSYFLVPLDLSGEPQHLARSQEHTEAVHPGDAFILAAAVLSQPIMLTRLADENLNRPPAAILLKDPVGIKSEHAREEGLQTRSALLLLPGGVLFRAAHYRHAQPYPRHDRVPEAFAKEHLGLLLVEMRLPVVFGRLLCQLLSFSDSASGVHHSQHSQFAAGSGLTWGRSRPFKRSAPRGPSQRAGGRGCGSGKTTGRGCPPRSRTRPGPCAAPRAPCP